MQGRGSSPFISRDFILLFEQNNSVLFEQSCKVVLNTKVQGVIYISLYHFFSKAAPMFFCLYVLFSTKWSPLSVKWLLCHSHLKSAKSNKQKRKSDPHCSYKAFLIWRFFFPLTYFGVQFILTSLHFKINNYIKKGKVPTGDKSITNIFIT